MSARNVRPEGIGSWLEDKAMSIADSLRPARRATLLSAVCLALAVAAPFASAAQRAAALQPFSVLELNLPARYVIRESGVASWLVRGDSEVINRIVVEQHDDRVRVFVPGSITIQGQLVIEINTVGLKDLVVNGAGEVQGHGFTGPDFSLRSLGAAAVKLSGLDVDKVRVEMQGSGTVELSGRASTERLKIAGSGECHAADLVADQVEVKLTGSGQVEVMAHERLEVQMAGSGTVRYRGEPKLSSSISGSGSVAKM
jgi:Putative auto-transporter adhesin, head GIN domain